MSKEEQIGFHKGALSTLLKEREEMVRIVGIVDQLIRMHGEALKKLGVDIEEKKEKKKKKSIEESLKEL